MNKLLPHDVYGRIVLGLLSALFLPLSGCVVWLLLRAYLFGPAPNPRTLDEWLLLLFIETFFTTLLAVSLGGLLWSMAKPAWVEHAISSFAWKLALATCCFALVGTAIVLWAIWRIGV